MSTAADALRALLDPMLGDFGPLQFPIWIDPGLGVRSAVLRSVGGGLAELVRRPQFTLALVGGSAGDALLTADKAEEVVQLLRWKSGGLVFIQPGEPVHMPTADRRPLFEIALSVITV